MMNIDTSRSAVPRRLTLALLACGVAATFAPSSLAADPPEIPPSRVGMPVSLSQVVLPGGELEPLPITDKSPIVLRIDGVYPHGTDHRYDLVYYGVEPGDYDLTKFLRRKDGSTTEDLPPLAVTIQGQLPAGQIEPHELQSARLPWLGGYRWLAVSAAAVWMVGLYWLLKPRRRRREAVAGESAAAPLSLADRLRPLVNDALAGRLPPPRLAELERALVHYWRRRLNLEDVSPAEALARLRDDPEASPLITQLETWLHRPPGRNSVDVEALLRPYRNIAPEELEPQPARAAEVAT